MFESLLGFIDRWNMARTDPPEREKILLHLLEPIATLPQQFPMRALIDVIFERFDRFPDGEIEEDAIVVLRTQIGRVALLSLQPPDESRTAIRERINFGETGHEALHDGSVEWSAHSGDVDLGNVTSRIWHQLILNHEDETIIKKQPAQRAIALYAGHIYQLTFRP